MIIAVCVVLAGLVLRCCYLKGELVRTRQEWGRADKLWRDTFEEMLKSKAKALTTALDRDVWRDRWKAGAFELDAATMAALSADDPDYGDFAAKAARCAGIPDHWPIREWVDSEEAAQLARAAPGLVVGREREAPAAEADRTVGVPDEPGDHSAIDHDVAARPAVAALRSVVSDDSGGLGLQRGDCGAPAGDSGRRLRQPWNLGRGELR
jgi:hypothetical protein